MEYRFNVVSRRMDLDNAFDCLDEFQKLVSKAIAEHHIDASLNDTLQMGNADISKSDEWQQQTQEDHLRNEHVYGRMFPQLAVRGVFLSAVSFVEDFFRFFARSIAKPNLGKSLRRRSECREALLSKWFDKEDPTNRQRELEYWQKLNWFFEIRNLLMHVDETDSSEWNETIRNAIKSLQCKRCTELGEPSKNCSHLVGVEKDLVIVGGPLPQEFISTFRAYMEIQYRKLP